MQNFNTARTKITVTCCVLVTGCFPELFYRPFLSFDTALPPLEDYVQMDCVLGWDESFWSFRGIAGVYKLEVSIDSG